MVSFSTFLNTIILLGTLQGFIICCLLFYSKKNRPGNRLLAKLIFLMSLASLNLYLNEVGFFNLNGLTSTLNALLPMVVVMPMGPLVAKPYNWQGHQIAPIQFRYGFSPAAGLMSTVADLAK